MNKKFYLPLFALCSTLFLTSFAATSQEATCVTITSHSNSSIGQKWIKGLMEAYNDGKFETRLATINAEVQKGIEDGTFDKYEASAREEKEASNTPKAKKEIEELTTRLEPYRHKISQLKEETKDALIKVSMAYPASEIVKSIKIYNDVSCCNAIGCCIEKYSSLQKVENLLGNSENAPYSQFKEIIKKYDLKRYAIMLLQKDFQMIEGVSVGFPTDSAGNQYEIDSTLIRYEELLESLKIAQTQADDSLVTLITQAINEYIELRGRGHDVNYLRLLGNKSVTPKDVAEEQVAEIMSNFQSKQKILIQEYFPMPTE